MRCCAVHVFWHATISLLHLIPFFFSRVFHGNSQRIVSISLEKHNPYSPLIPSNPLTSNSIHKMSSQPPSPSMSTSPTDTAQIPNSKFTNENYRFHIVVSRPFYCSFRLLCLFFSSPRELFSGEFVAMVSEDCVMLLDCDLCF